VRRKSNASQDVYNPGRRFVVLNRSGETLLQSGQFDDKPSTKRAASSLARAVSGAEIIDATKPAAAGAKSSAPRPVMKR
jgi:hypothetical protein